MEKERLHFCIGRFDQYYDSVNSKSNVQLALGVFVTGGLISLYPWMQQKVDCTLYVHLLLGTEILIGLTAVLLTLMATTPYLASRGNSLHYFGSIAKMSGRKFAGQSQRMTATEEIEDLRTQVSALAKGLRAKFIKLRVVSWLIIAQFILAIPFIVIVYINLKK
ncbi:Pycsar system effector family protein [Pedobacter faecalis]|uniref:Pycsar system effector family protein n=1 Tax=Pedobacter faecalis TaxID=3041495 RepID=UPI00254C6A1B|nr:Pycsar system effector family protein [Pedobacter sp. ELA7]